MPLRPIFDVLKIDVKLLIIIVLLPSKESKGLIKEMDELATPLL